MDLDMPTDLINQSQIEFRERAGLSSFNPSDTTLPPPPTVEASISTLDPSPPYLRCKICQGKLLRGLQSLICVYCGEYQKKDLHPDPISFNSTNGYSWLLQSLRLNGSERVGSLAEGNGMHGGQSPAEALVTVSELLNLQISWRDVPKKPDNSLNDKASENTSSLNLGTTNLDNFFTERIASEEQQVSSKQDETKAFEASFPSSIDVNDDVASSDWNAEFQFADSKVESGNPEPVDPFVGAETDLSIHIDAVFGQMEGLSNMKKPNEGKDWVDDDLFANMGPTTFQQAEKFDPVVQPKDEVSSHVNDLSSSKDVEHDWFSDGNWQKSSAQKDDNSHNKPNNSSTESASVSVDWFENANWGKSGVDKKDDIKELSSDVDNLKKQDLETTDWFQDSQWSTGASSATNMVATSKDDDDDEFDDWNDFTSSTGNQDSWKQSSNQDLFQDSWKQTSNQDSFPDSWKQSSNEKTGGSEKNPELNLFPSTQEVDFGMFSGSSSNTFPESSTASRNVNTPNASTSSENDVEMLMSQMHDLSFMLKSELSVPSKPDDDFGHSHS